MKFKLFFMFLAVLFIFGFLDFAFFESFLSFKYRTVWKLQQGLRALWIERCKCWKPSRAPLTRTSTSNKISLCNAEATLIGPGQRVLSYSFFGDNVHRSTNFSYEAGLAVNVKSAKTHYPGFLMRIYSDHSLERDSSLCKLLCTESDLFWCDINEIPLSDLTNVTGPIWRFLPLGDPLVEEFHSRDTDSTLTRRERNAVKDWEKTGKPFHLMRDHPYWHRKKVLAGMWGAKLSSLRDDEGYQILCGLLEKGRGSRRYGVDQMALNDILFTPEFYSRILAHDSFHCATFNQTDCRPFPDAEWPSRYFVGDVLE